MSDVRYRPGASFLVAKFCCEVLHPSLVTVVLFFLTYLDSFTNPSTLISICLNVLNPATTDRKFSSFNRRKLLWSLVLTVVLEKKSFVNLLRLDIKSF